MTNKRLIWLRPLSFVAALFTLLAVSGCVNEAQQIPHNAPSGGQTFAELKETLASLPGLIVEDVSWSAPNAKFATGFSYRLQVSPGYKVADGEAFVNFLVYSAWSVRDAFMPNTTIAITFFVAPGDTFHIGKAAVAAGWSSPTSTDLEISANGSSSATVWLTDLTTNDSSSKAILARLGNWPGPAPALPAGLIAPVT